MNVTVCTLTRNRTAHLVNQVRGLMASARQPAAHVVAVMGGEDPRPSMPVTPWQTRFVDVGGTGTLPLAQARNVAVESAETAAVVLLDVDCIPSSTLLDAYATALADLDGVFMGGVRYLPAGWGAEFDGSRRSGPDAALTAWDDDALYELGRRHPGRPEPPDPGEVARTAAYEQFWSLSFGVRRATMLDRIGGFDEQYGGYGAEDTDFAFRAREAAIPLAWLGGAWAYHQHHATYDPPLQHVSSIVANARRFRDVWGRWPMEGWLLKFAELGLVRWDPRGDVLELRREPTPDEMRAAERVSTVPGGT